MISNIENDGLLGVTGIRPTHACVRAPACMCACACVHVRMRVKEDPEPVIPITPSLLRYCQAVVR